MVKAARLTETRNHLAALGEIAFAPLSFVLYRCTRFVVQRLVQVHARKRTLAPAVWQTLDGPGVRKPFNLLALMTSAPRWNTHAIIALAGPLQVQHTLRFDAATAATSARSWTVVVHAEPAHRIVASLGPLDTCSEDRWQSLDLPSGSYRLALRYYHWSEPIVLPAIEVDGSVAVRDAVIPRDSNEFYREPDWTSSTFFYLCMHSYVCTLLRYQRWFSSAFIAREYLPAGNPQTTFFYGYLPARASVNIQLTEDLLMTHDVYFTAYNRSSFPTMWCQLLESTQTTAPSHSAGSYLIRVHAQSSSQPHCSAQQVRVQVRPTGANEVTQQS